jgi:hypothetical protein
MTDDKLIDAYDQATRDHNAKQHSGADRAPDTLVSEASAHRRRCKSLPPVQTGEAERLVAEFLATKGITACPTRYVARVEQRSMPTRSGY